jgi:hypothetical protein
MTPQLHLTDDNNLDPAANDPAGSDWTLDPAVRDRGQEGLKKARAALRSARPVNYRVRSDTNDIIGTLGTQAHDQEFDAA